MSSWMPNLRAFLHKVRYNGRWLPTLVVRRAIRSATMDAYRVAVETTHRDTGYAQYNWQVTEGTLPSGFIGGVRNPESNYPQPVARERVGSWPFINPYTVTYISNYAPYIEILDRIGRPDGSIVPQQMLQQAKDAAQRSLRVSGVGGSVTGRYGEL